MYQPTPAQGRGDINVVILSGVEGSKAFYALYPLGSSPRAKGNKWLRHFMMAPK